MPGNMQQMAEVREYDRLFMVENPSADERDFHELLNPDSFHDYPNCYVEEYAANKQNRQQPVDNFKLLVPISSSACGSGTP